MTSIGHEHVHRGGIALIAKEFHPLADMLPLVQGAEFDRLVANIREQGLLNPTTSYQGMKSLYRPFDN